MMTRGGIRRLARAVASLGAPLSSTFTAAAAFRHRLVRHVLCELHSQAFHRETHCYPIVSYRLQNRNCTHQSRGNPMDTMPRSRHDPVMRLESGLDRNQQSTSAPDDHRWRRPRTAPSRLVFRLRAVTCVDPAGGGDRPVGRSRRTGLAVGTRPADGSGRWATTA
jgi:hypothetical protein